MKTIRSSNNLKSYFRFIDALLILVLFCGSLSVAQDQPVRKDTAMLPRLEIPEITIVGKKAITLPFARKGEIYSTEIFEASLPDSSLIEERTGPAFPLGTLPRYEESFVPFHLSAQGSFGSFATLHGSIYADYKKHNWGLYGNGELKTSNGHVTNADGKSIDLNFKAYALVETDNAFLGSFRTLGGLKFYHDSYGLYGIKNSSVDRSRTAVNFSAELHSVERESGYLDLNLSTDIWSIKDIYPLNNFSSSTVSPKFEGTYGINFGQVNLNTGLHYQSSSLNFNYPVQTPSLLSVLIGAQWNLTPIWKLELGGSFIEGSNSNGGSRTFIRPFASLQWQIDRDRQLSVWFKPEMNIDSYNELMNSNPYLMRQIIVNPEERSVNFGSRFWYNSELFTVEIKGNALVSSGKPVQVSNLGLVDLVYVNSEQFILNLDGIVYPTEPIQIHLSGVLQPSYERGKSTQLPMIPLAKMGARGEISLNYPVTLWSGIEFWSRQNATLNGSTKLKERLLLNAGVSTTIIPRILISLEISNIFNRKYEWWSGYIAPGISFLIDAKFNIR
ncbi:MAG: hypothetical protein HZB59_13715 [Ignavibacteriales bacterium]|nr:hypothetical protein [Ignavibacteriales bacterium]